MSRMNFVKTAVLESKTGQERKTKATEYNGLDFFNNRDRYVSDRLENYYSRTGGVDREKYVNQKLREFYTEREGSERAAEPHEPPSAVEKVDVDDYGLQTRSQEDHEFLEGHLKMQKRQQDRTRLEIETFRRCRSQIREKKTDDESFESLVETQRQRASIKLQKDEAESVSKS
eukprot:GHVN01025826.1.p1 GENE.GHVN01025826.1~~GHVN01025826.1.p1  ORF type:complete len:173 (-),score=22.57 GHVN01025826.1:1093-1611(-)